MKELLARGFADVSDLLRPGIFVLVRGGKVVYVGTAKKYMIERIEFTRGTDRPSWLPRIRFDEVFAKYTHPDKIAAERDRLIEEYRPRYNEVAVGEFRRIG